MIQTCQQQTFHLQNLLGIMASKRKRLCYDAAFKPKVVEFVEEYRNRAAEYEYTISENLFKIGVRPKKVCLPCLKQKSMTRKATFGPWIGKKNWLSRLQNKETADIL